MVDIERDEGDELLAHAQVEQVVAQREIEQLALPYLLACGGTLRTLGHHVEAYLLAYVVGGRVVFQPVGHPLAVHAEG